MWRRTARDRLALVVFGAITLLLLTLSFRSDALEGVSSAVGQVIGVFQTGVRTVTRPVESAVTGLHELGRLREENDRLRRENQELLQQSETYTNVLRENSDFRKMYELETEHQLSTVKARVVGASLSGLEQSVLLDKGTMAGIGQGTAALGPEGLVGRVIQARSRNSKVMLLTDPGSAIGVKLDRSGETGVVQGNGTDLLRLELVSSTVLDQGNVREGDVLVTSGQQGGIFPPDIPVGRVDKVDLSSRSTTYRILVRPFAPLSRLDVVSVVNRSTAP